MGARQLLLLLVATAGCSGHAPARAPDLGRPAVPATVTPDAGVVDRDVVHFAIDSEPAQLDPDVEGDRWSWRLSFDVLYEPLFRLGPGGAVEPVLADRVDIAPDGARITAHVRPGVEFHDGTPLTARDVVFTLEKVRNARRAGRTPGGAGDPLDLIERIEQQGEVVRIWARAPSVTLAPAIAAIGILPEHVFSKGDLARDPRNRAANRHPVGTGPFVLASWERHNGARHVVLARNPKYWGPPPAARELDFTVEDDLSRALARAKRGELDVVADLPPSYLPDAVDSPSIAARFETVRVPTARRALVLWNAARPGLGDARVRRALGMAVDRERLVRDVRHGLGRARVSPVDDAKAPPADPAGAGALLDAAGVTRVSAAGARQVEGHPWRITLLAPTGSSEATAIAKRLVESWQKLGVAVDVASGDLGSVLDRARRGSWDALLVEYSGDRDAPDGDVGALLRRGVVVPTGWSSRDVDALLDELARPLPPDERARARADLAAKLATEAPALFLYEADDEFLWARRLGPPPLDGDFVRLRAITPR